MSPPKHLTLRVTQPSYDLAGANHYRVTKHFFISKMTPEKENFAGGPGWKCLLLLGALHGLGKAAGWGIFLFGTQARTIITRLQRNRLK